MSGNFSGGSFSGAVGGFSVDGGAVTTVPAGGTSRKRRRTKAEQDNYIFEQNLRNPTLNVPTPLEAAAIDMGEDHSEDDEILLLALMKVLH